MFAAIVLYVAFAQSALAGLAEGIAAYERGDYATAVGELRPIAEQGDAGAQRVLGGIYQGDRDYAEAMHWFLRAAAQGDAVAQFSIGELHATGRGVPLDSAEATIWYLKAAERGLAEAQFVIGDKYYRGQGVPQDDVQSYKWLSIAEMNELLPRHRWVIPLSAAIRDALTKRMTAAQIAEAQKLAGEWQTAFERRARK